VHLSRVELRHFRNLGRQELELPPEGVAIVGANAQGKSNLLEAIYYLETFRSFRGARDAQLVAFGQDVFRVEGSLDVGADGATPDGRRGARIAAAYERRRRRKKVTVDGTEPDRLGDALGRLGAVVFSPADVALVSEGPSERRRFLDIVLSLNVKGYLRALQLFRQVLSQRNATLKEDDSGAVVRAWDAQLVRSGAEVMATRRRWVADRSEAFERYYDTISGGATARMRYRPNVEPSGGDADGPEAVEQTAAAYREALAASAETERRMRTTMVGPQRDDLALTLEGDERDLDVRDYGSGGQRRTAALALRLVEAATIRDARGREPLVLMDDVFAELDPSRSERILHLIEREETGQVILTAPKESDVRIRRDTLPRWRIEGGRIER
jgi:DNA replication and repair protein RecF